MVWVLAPARVPALVQTLLDVSYSQIHCFRTRVCGMSRPDLVVVDEAKSDVMSSACLTTAFLGAVGPMGCVAEWSGVVVFEPGMLVVVYAWVEGQSARLCMGLAHGRQTLSESSVSSLQGLTLVLVQMFVSGSIVVQTVPIDLAERRWSVSKTFSVLMLQEVVIEQLAAVRRTDTSRPSLYRAVWHICRFD